jgi:hypothetical protein
VCGAVAQLTDHAQGSGSWIVDGWRSQIGRLVHHELWRLRLCCGALLGRQSGFGSGSSPRRGVVVG